jgi:hypothetical protein
MSLEAAEKLALSAKIPIPDIVEILPEFWGYKKAASAGGKERHVDTDLQGLQRGGAKAVLDHKS